MQKLYTVGVCLFLDCGKLLSFSERVKFSILKTLIMHNEKTVSISVPAGSPLNLQNLFIFQALFSVVHSLKYPQK